MMIGIRVKIPKETPKTHRYGKLISFHCERCDKHLASLYETDFASGGISKDWRYCSYCGQVLDFGKYYVKD